MPSFRKTCILLKLLHVNFIMTSQNEVCNPIDKLEDIWNFDPNKKDWSSLVIPMEPRTEFCVPGSQFTCRNRFRTYKGITCADVPKTLVCHDMMGGYLNDKYVNGAPTEKLDGTEYIFYHWYSIDIFVYFSHHMLTIPPLGWINAAHKHSVAMLGTFITEDRDGSGIVRRIFQDEETAIEFAEKLAQICLHYNFDGYLLNIENSLPSSESIKYLLAFIRHLKKLLPYPRQVIWYDSVTTDTGSLSWQDDLNDRNAAAFDACDGIFLNYGWRRHDIQQTALRAGSRKHDVYVGIDVFGRNGGGGWDTGEDFEDIRKADLSVALFAQGWTYEKAKRDTYDHNIQEKRFWTPIWQHLYVHGPTQLPFSTKFSRGVGFKTDQPTEEGNYIPWFDMKEQSHMPTVPFCCCSETECFRLRKFEGCHEKGGCMLVNPRHGIRTLFISHFELPKEGVKISLALKWVRKESTVDLLITTNQRWTYVLSTNNTRNNSPQISAKRSDYSFVYPRINAEITTLENEWSLVSFQFNVLNDLDRKNYITEISIRNERHAVNLGSFAIE